jgi:hypothetical protein
MLATVRASRRAPSRTIRGEGGGAPSHTAMQAALQMRDARRADAELLNALREVELIEHR